MNRADGNKQSGKSGVSRRTLLRFGAGLAGGALLPAGLTGSAFAAESHPPLGRIRQDRKGKPSL